MRANSTNAINQMTLPKDVSLRATFRQTLPVFTAGNLTDSLGLTDPAWIDACVIYPGFLRVTSVGNVLYTQRITDPHAAWPGWTNTGIALKAGSRPAVDGGYVWYQKADGQICYRNYPTWATEVSVRNMPGPMALAPLYTRCYGLWQRHAGSWEIVSLMPGDSSQYYIYGPTTMPRVDVVQWDTKEYFYTMDRDEGRVIEIQHSGNAQSGKDSYGVAKPIIPIDAIDDVYGFKLGYASKIDGRIVVTGRLTRTSDDTPVAMDVYATGPEYFSLGREMFIQGDVNLNGKMLRWQNEYFVLGAQRYYYAKATTLFGVDDPEGHPDLETTTSDFASIKLQEAEGRSTNLDIDLSPALDHSAIRVGSDLVLEMAYNNNWVKLATCSLDADRSISDEQGQTRIVSGVGKSAKRLAQWAPDQGVYIPSQARMFSNPASMTRVLRASGRWESVDPDDPDAAVKLTDLNKLGVLYSSSRASRGGTMRAKFQYPSDSYFKPYYGVAINYYRESAVEAASRLGVEINDLEDDMFGHNGIVAIYSATEHNGAAGISLNLWRDSVLTKMTSALLTIPADTNHWLQIEFIEGEIRVKYRLDSNATWTDVITMMYNRTELPWKRETLGRGAIVMKNIMPTFAYYGFSSSDLTIAIEDHSALPSSGSVLIESEVISYNGKSTYNRSYPLGTSDVGWSDAWLLNPQEATAQANGFNGERLILNGVPDTMRGNYPDHSFVGAALVAIGLAPNYNYGLNNTFRITDWDTITPQTWAVNQYYAGWLNHVGNGAYGYWWTDPLQSAIYVSTDPSKILSYGGEMRTGPYSVVQIKPAIYVTGRAQAGTVATSHSQGQGSLYTTKSVLCSVVGSFSQDEDQSIEDALKTIVRMSGGEASCKALIDGWRSFSAPGMVSANPGKNFIATLELPDTMTILTGTGIAFRGSPNIYFQNGRPWADQGCYYIKVLRDYTGYYLDLWSQLTGNMVLLERVPIRTANTNGAGTANVPSGTLKISVQDDLFSVWLNGRYLHTFRHDAYQTGTAVAFVSQQTGMTRLHLSELDDLLADIVVGTRGNGMSVLSELLGDRHILWREEPDGSLYFYRTRHYVGPVPDVLSAVSSMETDTYASRIRAEGLNISEIYDAEIIQEHGNSFATINARHANNVEEARAEAEFLIDESWRNSQPKQVSLVVHPGLQPGDAADFTRVPGGDDTALVVRGQSIVIGFSGSNFVCDMQCDLIPWQRE